MNKNKIIAIVIYILFVFILLYSFTYLLYPRINFPFSGFASEGILTYVQLQPEYSIVESGDKIILGISLVQLGNRERRDVVVSLFLNGDDNKKLLLSSQSIALETTSSSIFELNIPEELKSDSYEIDVEVRDTKNELLSSTSQRIFINKNFFIKINKDHIFYLLLILFVIVASILFIIINAFLNSANKKYMEKKDFLRKNEK